MKTSRMSGFIAAFGNSDGDLQMLQWTAAGKGASFCLYVHHSDAEREWAYDRNSSISRLDKGLDEAMAKVWTVADMKNDWKIIFLFEKRQRNGAMASFISFPAGAIIFFEILYKTGAFHYY